MASNDAPYMDEDAQWGAVVAPTFNPPDEDNNYVQAPGQRLQPYGVSQGAPPMIAAPPAQAATPAATTRSGDANGMGGMAQQGIAGQLRNAQASEKTVGNLAAEPDEATQEAPLMKQRQALQAATPVPTAQQYRPTVGQRIFRGIKAGARGLAEGGILGAAVGAVDPTIVGAQAYGAPNKQFDLDTAKNQRDIAGVDDARTALQKAYKDRSDRAKAIATEQRGTATSFKDVATGATDQEKAETDAKKEAETERHNPVEEQLTAGKNADEAKNQQGDLADRQRRTSIEGGRLKLERDKWDAAQDASSSGDPDQDARRQPLIDKATQDIQSIEDKYTYNAKRNTYQDDKGDSLTPQQFNDLKNNVSTKLDATLTGKKMKPLGVRFSVNDAMGSQYKKGAPAKSDSAAKQTPHSRQNVSVGQTVMYQGKERKVKGFSENGKVQLEP